MGIENNPNLDELTRLTLRVIELETEIKRIMEESQKTADFMRQLEVRLFILEEARKKQIELNATFAVKEKTEKPKPVWFFWK